MATNRRILVLGGGASLGAALAAVLAGAAEVVVVEPSGIPPVPDDGPMLAEILDEALLASPRLPLLAPSGYGPHLRGKKGKVRRW